MQDAGYDYSFDRDLYFNRKTKKVFSFEFVEDSGEAELEAKVKEPVPSTEGWHFYFNSPPSAAVKRDLATILG